MHLTYQYNGHNGHNGLNELWLLPLWIATKLARAIMDCSCKTIIHNMAIPYCQGLIKCGGKLKPSIY